MIEFLPLTEMAVVKKHSAKMAGWVYDSGSDFFNALFGDGASALGKIQSWICRPDSEFSGLLATLALLEDTGPVGVLIALPGREIGPRRRADLLALIKDLTHEQRAALKQHLARLTDLSAPVGDDDFYIRTLAVDAENRGRGFGRELLAKGLANAEAAGLRRIRLDVQTNNHAAINLYRGAGFEQIHEGTVPELGIGMYSMLLED